MQRSFGSHTLFAICAAMAILLTALGAVQYRWSTRVAVADAQREREHLESAASLFANEFNGIVGKTVLFLQNDAWSAVQAKQRITTVPKIIGELYFLDLSRGATPAVLRLTPDGFFAPSAMPAWLRTAHCAPLTIDPPAALVAPIIHMSMAENRPKTETHVVRFGTSLTGKCFVARIDQQYLRDALFPQLIRQSFGATATREYEFAVVPRTRQGDAIYGSPLRADLRKPFFSSQVFFTKSLPGGLPNLSGRAAVYVQRDIVQRDIVTKGPADLLGLLSGGIWELQVAHQGVPLAAAFERTRRLDLLLSLGVEALLLLAIAFLVVGARRMARLANQKMQFVAGVSHELRTPVSAIAMLSRNQADGLVTGTERVKQYGELIHQQTRRLSEMVEHTLQYAGIHSGLRRPVKNEIDLRRLIEETVQSRREELEREGFSIEVELVPELPVVSGDASLMRIAIDNLISNAQKHADGGRWIRVSANYSAAEKEIRIDVQDRGPGIPQADQATIFEPFSRGRAATDSQIPGSGLGLSLVRSAAEAHHGTVTLVSEPGQGSTFTLHLPL